MIFPADSYSIHRKPVSSVLMTSFTFHSSILKPSTTRNLIRSIIAAVKLFFPMTSFLVHALGIPKSKKNNLKIGQKWPIFRNFSSFANLKIETTPQRGQVYQRISPASKYSEAFIAFATLLVFVSRVKVIFCDSLQKLLAETESNPWPLPSKSCSYTLCRQKTLIL